MMYRDDERATESDAPALARICRVFIIYLIMTKVWVSVPCQPPTPAHIKPRCVFVHSPLKPQIFFSAAAFLMLGWRVHVANTPFVTLHHTYTAQEQHLRR